MKPKLCDVCKKQPVTIADRCTNGIYMCRSCGYATSIRPRPAK